MEKRPKTLASLIEFSKTLNQKQFSFFIDFLKQNSTLFETYGEKELKKIKTEYGFKNLDVMLDSKPLKSKISNSWLGLIYKKDITEINIIIRNDNFLKELNGAKIILYGETGTGKTSLVKEIINQNFDIEYIEINFTSLVSPKMGQTQINILSLGEQLKQKNNKKIIFLDELDSIVSNRVNSDLGEHSRIVATFIKFLDMLDWNIIFIAATNIKQIIDDAIIRRFNILLESKKIDFFHFFELLELENFDLSPRRKKSIQKTLDKKYFTFSEVKAVINNKKIFEMTKKEKFQDWVVVIYTFWSNFDLKKWDEKISRRDQAEIKKIEKLKLREGVI